MSAQYQRRLNIKIHIPNLFTLANLFCGLLAIVVAFEGNLSQAAYWVGIGALFDFLDGMVARGLRVSGELGKQLDSLADMVTFGVVPGVILFQLLSESTEHPHLPYIGFMVTVFSALRLARFNIDTRQSHSFIGLPTPACALLVVSLPLIIDYSEQLFAITIVTNTYFLAALSIVMSLLLVSGLPLFALKFKDLRWQNNRIRYLFLIAALILIFAFSFVAIGIIILLYIILSVVKRVVSGGSHPNKKIDR